jgi:hypothetical protein
MPVRPANSTMRANKIFCVFLLWSATARPSDFCLATMTQAGLSAADFEAGKSLHNLNPRLHEAPVVGLLANELRQRGLSVAEPAQKVAAWAKYLELAMSHPSEVAALKEIFIEQHVIREEDIPESYYEMQVTLARNLGHGTINLDSAKKAELARVAIQDQKFSLSEWVDYLSSSDTSQYPAWVKTWILNAVTKLSKFDVEGKKFQDRTANFVGPFPELNREAVGLVVDAVQKHSASGENVPSFSKLYAQQLAHLEGKSRDLTVTEGKWVKYSRGSSPEILVRSLQGQNTGWCTAAESTAKQQLQAGDFYVYYSNDKDGRPSVPRLAIRMQGSKIGEVRGIAKNQNLDAEIAHTEKLKEKLEEFGEEGKKYEKASNDMKAVTELAGKQKGGVPFSAAELRFLYEIDHPIIGFGYHKDPRVEEIKSQRDTKKDLAIIFDCTEREVSTTDEGALSGGIKVHFGNLTVPSKTALSGHALPTVVYGDFTYRGTDVEGVHFPEIVTGGLNLKQLTDFKGVRIPRRVQYIRLGVKVEDYGQVLERNLLEDLLDFKGTIYLWGGVMRTPEGSWLYPNPYPPAKFIDGKRVLNQD